MSMSSRGSKTTAQSTMKLECTRWSAGVQRWANMVEQWEDVDKADQPHTFLSIIVSYGSYSHVVHAILHNLWILQVKCDSSTIYSNLCLHTLMCYTLYNNMQLHACKTFIIGRHELCPLTMFHFWTSLNLDDSQKTLTHACYSVYVMHAILIFNTIYTNGTGIRT